MERTTVLARLRTLITYSPEMRSWCESFPEAWFRDETSFLAEFSATWEHDVLEVSNRRIRAYFQQLGVPGDSVPTVQRGDSYRGSWIIESTVVFAGSITAAYHLLKGVSELPKIADGLTRLKESIRKELTEKLGGSVRRVLSEVVSATKAQLGIQSPDVRKRLAAPPPRPIQVDFTIDARPLTTLRPVIKSHRLHMAVAISRDAVTVENLADEPLEDVRIGLFRSDAPRSQGCYGDAFSASVPRLSGGQSIAKDTRDFTHGGASLDLSDGRPCYVDCWVQDKTGIYLFNFYLEQE